MKKINNIIFRVIVTLLCVFMLTACDKNKEAQLILDNGQVKQLSDYRGHWVILEYWAAWCSTCRHEIPALNAFYHEHQNKDVILFGVNFDDVPANMLLADATALGIKYPVLLNDPKKALGIKHIAGIPYMVLINPTGHLVKQFYGKATKGQLDSMIHKLSA